MRKVNWQPLHEGFPGLGYKVEDITIRPSSVWRGLHTVRDGATVLVYDCPLHQALQIAERYYNMMVDADIKERCRQEIQASGSC